MDEKYEAQVVLDRGALPASAMAGKQGMAAFKELVASVDTAFEKCLLDFYQPVLEAIVELLLKCNQAEAGRDTVPAVFFTGLCVDWDTLHKHINEQPLLSDLYFDTLKLVPSSSGGGGSPVQAVVEAVTKAEEEDRVLLISILQIDCFTQKGLVRDLMEVISQRNARVCLLFNSTTGLSGINARIDRASFARLEVSMGALPLPSALIDSLLDHLLRFNPMSPLHFDGLLLQSVRDQFLQEDYSLAEVRKMLVLALHSYCQGCAPDVAEKVAKKTHRNKKRPGVAEGYIEALEAAHYLEKEALGGGGDEEEQQQMAAVGALQSLHCKRQAGDKQVFDDHYQSLKNAWTGWSKTVWIARLSRLAEILDAGSLSALHKQCQKVIHSLEAAHIATTPTTEAPPTGRGRRYTPRKSKGMTASDLMKQKTEKEKAGKISATQRRGIDCLMDALFLDALPRFTRRQMVEMNEDQKYLKDSVSWFVRTVLARAHYAD